MVVVDLGAAGVAVVVGCCVSVIGCNVVPRSVHGGDDSLRV